MVLHTCSSLLSIGTLIVIYVHLFEKSYVNGLFKNSNTASDSNNMKESSQKVYKHNETIQIIF